MSSQSIVPQFVVAAVVVGAVVLWKQNKVVLVIVSGNDLRPKYKYCRKRHPVDVVVVLVAGKLHVPNTLLHCVHPAHDGPNECDRIWPLWCGIVFVSYYYCHGKTSDDDQRTVAIEHCLLPTYSKFENGTTHPCRRCGQNSFGRHNYGGFHCIADTAERQRTHWPTVDGGIRNPYSDHFLVGSTAKSVL